MKKKFLPKIKAEYIPTIIFWSILALVFIMAALYFALGWQKKCYDVSVYLDAAIKTVFTVVIAKAVIKTLSYIMEHMKTKSQRAKTVSALLYSLIKYCIAIASIIIILILFLGEKYITELFSGIGVLALIIGLGCQTLISDIVAGIFIVFEGNFQVGDVVVINGWRGTIIEIGLRTTIIEDVGGNKKIVNNSGISEIVNNSQALSVAAVCIGIEYDESIERVERIISENIEEMKKKIPSIKDGPYYKGIEELASSSVNLKFVAYCKEEDKFQVQRDLNRQIKLIFDKHKIGIPFPQVTVSYLKDAQNEKVSAKTKTIAENFIAEQKKNTADDDNAAG